MPGTLETVCGFQLRSLTVSDDLGLLFQVFQVTSKCIQVYTSFNACKGHHRAGAYDCTISHTHKHTHTHCSIPYSSTCTPASAAISYVTSRTTRSMPNSTPVNHYKISVYIQCPNCLLEPHLPCPILQPTG